MKKSIFNFLFIITILMGITTPQNVAAQDYYTAEEQPAQFPGGDETLLKWLSYHIIYPTMAIEQNFQGEVVVKFVVEKDGSISNPSIESSVHPLLDEEALRVINLVPPIFNPAKQNGKNVRSWYTIPINFKLYDDKESTSNTEQINNTNSNEYYNDIREVKEVAPIPVPEEKSESIKETDYDYDENIIFTTVERPAEYPGGVVALSQFLSANIQYPDLAAVIGGIEGRVVVQFVVEKDGSISYIKIARGKHPLLDVEAARVVKSITEPFTPAMQNGKNVRYWFTLPLNFKLQK